MMEKLSLTQVAVAYEKLAAGETTILVGRDGTLRVMGAATRAAQEAAERPAFLRRLGAGALRVGKSIGQKALIAGGAAGLGIAVGALADNIANSGKLERSKKEVAKLFPDVKEQLDRTPVGFDRAFDSIARTAPDIAGDPIGAAMALRSVHGQMGMDPRQFRELAEAQKSLNALRSRGKMREGLMTGLGKGLGESIISQKA